MPNLAVPYATSNIQVEQYALTENRTHVELIVQVRGKSSLPCRRGVVDKPRGVPIPASFQSSYTNWPQVGFFGGNNSNLQPQSTYALYPYGDNVQQQEGR